VIRFDGKSEVEKGHVLYEIMPFDNLIAFLKGTIFQGNRLLESSTSKSDDMFDLLKLEEEFFVFALERVKFYMDMLKDIPEVADIFKQLDDAVGHEAIKDTRDMRTHADEYIGKSRKREKGQAQARFFTIPEDAPTILKSKPAIDATSSIRINDWYLIGGKINFFKTMEFLKKVLPSVEKVCQVEKMKILQSHKT